MKKISYIVFDHDGTLVDTDGLKIALYPGIKDLLSFIKSHGVEMFIWTARSKSSTLEIIKKLGVKEYFNDVCGCDSAPRKPSPDGIEYLVPEAKPSEVLVIGDSIGDMTGAKAFGASAVGVLWHRDSLSAKELMLEYGASNVYSDIDELKKYIEDKI